MTYAAASASTRFSLLLCACLLPASAMAQHEITWHSIDGGGAVFSSGGDWRLGGTIGQPDAGAPMSGGGYSLSGGFWPGADATPCDLFSDIDQDGDTDLQDLAYLLSSFGHSSGDPNYNAAADLDQDGVVSLQDLAYLLSDFGMVCP